MRGKVTIKDVAKKANVSKATVSYVLNGINKVSEETKQRVMAAVNELGYVPNSAAKSLATNEVKGTSEPSVKDLEIFPFYEQFLASFIKGKTGGNISNRELKQLQQIFEKNGSIPVPFLDEKTIFKPTKIALFMEYERESIFAIIGINPFFHEFITGVEYTAKDFGFSVTILNSNDSLDEQEFIEQGYLGAVVVGRMSEKQISFLEKQQIPVVVVDRYIKHPKFVTVTSDDLNGAYDSVEYLIFKGHKRIAFAGCEAEKGGFIKKRVDGYKKALADYGLSHSDEDIYLSEIAYSYEEGNRLAAKIIERGIRYDAVFCTSDIMAIGLMKGFMNRGYKIPEDISVMGYDNIQFSKYSNPELTTVDQNIFLKAETAVHIIRRKAAGDHVKDTYILPVTIVERESVSSRKE